MLLYNTAHGCQNLPVYEFRMYRWNRGCRFTSSVKAARIVRCRFGDRPSSYCERGFDNVAVRRIRPCCRTPEAIP